MKDEEKDHLCFICTLKTFAEHTALEIAACVREYDKQWARVKYEGYELLPVKAKDEPSA